MIKNFEFGRLLKPRHGKNNIGNIKPVDVAFLLGFNLLFFQQFLQFSVSHALSSIDELCAVGLFFLALKDYLGQKERLKTGTHIGRILLVSFLFLAVGAVGTLVNRIQLNAYPVLIDAFTSGKGLFCFASVLYLARSRKSRADAFIRIVIAECKLLTLILFVGALLNLVVDVGFGGEGLARYGLRPFAFIFYHPTCVVYLATGLAAVLFAHERRTNIWMFMLCFVLVATLRSKGFGEAVVLLLALFALGANKRGTRLRWWHVALAFGAVLVVGWSQLEVYYLSDDATDTARAVLARTSLDLAKIYFPIGAGFATFGSAVTVGSVYYSPIYAQYGFNSIWGLSALHPEFITDSFWPTVVGQFGFLGIFLMVAAIVLICFEGYGLAKSISPRAVGSFVVVVAYLLLSSTAESSFFAPQSIYLATCLCVSLLESGSCPALDVAAPSRLVPNGGRDLMKSNNHTVATLYGVGGLYNYGCEAIVRGTVFLLRAASPDVKVRYLTPRADDDARRIADLGIDVEQLHAGHRGVLLRAVNKCATALCIPFDSSRVDYDSVLNGTDLLVSIGGDIYTIPAYKRRKSRYPYFNQLVRAGQLAKEKGIPEIVIGASIGPFGDYAPAVDYYANHLRQMDLICCREAKSVNYLGTIGVKPNVCLLADPAFFVEGDSGCDVDGEKYLGINLSPLSLRELSGGVSNADCKRMADLVSELMDQVALPVMFVPHVLSPDEGDNDLLFLRRVRSAMDEEHRSKAIVVEPSGFLDAKKYLRRCRFVVAARMHCAVNAICEGVPTILLSYSQKAIGMCEFVYGESDWVLSLNHVEAQLPDKLSDLAAHEGAIREYLSNRMGEIRRGALNSDSFERLHGLISTLEE